MNDNGTFFPLWGTCMGYENMVGYAASAGFSVWGHYPYPNGSLPLEFTVDPRDTQMFGGLGDSAFFFADHDFTYNSHNYGIDP